MSHVLLCRYDIYLCLSARWYVHSCTKVSDGTDCCLDSVNSGLVSLKVPLVCVLRPLGDHDRLLLVLNVAEDLLCDEWHVWMKKLKCLDQNCLKCPECCCLCLILIVVETRLNHLDIPVTELLPDEVVYLGYSDTKLELLHVVCHLFCKCVDLGQDPAVSYCQV